MKNEFFDYVIDNDKANEDVDLIINQILDEIIKLKIADDIIAILLCGGFGRGEGSVILKDNTYVTTNDYDILAICKDDLDESELHLQAKKIEKKLGLNFFSIDILLYSDFCKFYQLEVISQSLFDVFMGSKILWQSQKNKFLDLKDIFNKYRATEHKITINSAFDVLKTRMWCSIALSDLDGDELFDKKYVLNYEFFYFQQVKLATAIVDAILIAEHRYFTPLFIIKMEELKNTDFYSKHDCRFLLHLIENKILNREILKLTKENMLYINKIYCDCLDYIIHKHVLKYILYKCKEPLQIIYYRKIKRYKYSDWLLSDYTALKKNDLKKLYILRDKMRRMYE